MLTEENKAEIARVNVWLNNKGLRHGILELDREPRLGSGHLPVLIDLLKSPLSPWMSKVVAYLIFAAKPDPQRRREAIDAILSIVRRNAGNDDNYLSLLVSNEVFNNVDSDKVHEVGEMALDGRYGELRDDLTYVLRKIGNEDAISYLQLAAKDPATAAVALGGLAHLRVDGTLALCENTLNNLKLDSDSRRAIKETHAKLKRLSSRKNARASHLTKDSIPAGLHEWSANFDRPEIPKALLALSKCFDRGFGKPEQAEIGTVIKELSLDQEARFKFTIDHNGKKSPLWLKIVCDDEAAYDMYVFAKPALIKCVDAALSKFTED
jgi:hypothetical protein